MELKPYWVFVAGFLIVLTFVAITVAQRSRGPSGFESYEGFAGANQFTMFGVPWCPHCVAAKPVFESLGPIVTIGERSVSFRYVNPEEDKAMASGYQIDGYPTFYLDKDGQRMKYSGPRTAAGIQQFLQENLA
jgi:thiol-disulfide isomerase/thioredoxin